MGGFEVLILVGMEPSVKYHSVAIYVLISAAKTQGDSAWWAVCVGRNPPKK
jgi:hypothetical protein